MATLEEEKEKLVNRALIKFNYDKKKARVALGITTDTLRYYIKKYK